jgi:hypothetical protein
LWGNSKHNHNKNLVKKNKHITAPNFSDIGNKILLIKMALSFFVTVSSATCHLPLVCYLNLKVDKNYKGNRNFPVKFKLSLNVF